MSVPSSGYQHTFYAIQAATLSYSYLWLELAKESTNITRRVNLRSTASFASLTSSYSTNPNPVMSLISLIRLAPPPDAKCCSISALVATHGPGQLRAKAKPGATTRKDQDDRKTGNTRASPQINLQGSVQCSSQTSQQGYWHKERPELRSSRKRTGRGQVAKIQAVARRRLLAWGRRTIHVVCRVRV